jgi:hypothetical protein
MFLFANKSKRENIFPFFQKKWNPEGHEFQLAYWSGGVME